MNTFTNAVKADLDNEMTVTANGMSARKTSASKVLDFFGKAGSSRGTDLSKEFTLALTENENLAMRALLWTRDVLEGAGERGQFRTVLASLEKMNPTLAGSVMHKIPELGRWDDLFVYQNPLNRSRALEMYADALRDGNGLAFKWAPREKSARSKDARDLREVLGMSPKQYRKFLSSNTQVVETAMCAGEWREINFSHVPSLASARYQKAFGRNAGEEYAKYLAELQKPVEQRDPKVKINAKAVYPYDVTKSVAKGNAAVADEQWKALPNYVGDAAILPMVDVSSSMGSLNYAYSSTVQPIDVAVSLGLYLSEKNSGPFKDTFLTFSGSPEFVQLKGTLSQRMKTMDKSSWNMNTNIQAAMQKILDLAVKHKVPQNDMPKMLLILSDMQFDQATRSGGYYSSSGSGWNPTAIQLFENQFAKAGYEMPRIVFWNLSPYGRDNTPVKFDDRGVAHVSGFSPAIMKSVLSNDIENFTPYNVMIKTLMKDRYTY